ncbi:hypothetical protein [Thalassotalea sp. PLHSN55]|uniref:hypothetical protein n=1 Tax=Thalassotalea sp. PLHSN55 TaxID=3435888 RepID=UPI003F859BD7
MLVSLFNLLLKSPLFSLIFSITLIFLSASAFSANYNNFKPLNNKLGRYAPTPYSQATMRGAVLVNDSKFAIARINPKSALALGRQLATRHPLAMAGMAALTYYQDDDFNWMEEPELSGEPPSYQPKSDLQSVVVRSYGDKIPPLKEVSLVLTDNPCGDFFGNLPIPHYTADFVDYSYIKQDGDLTYDITCTYQDIEYKFNPDTGGHDIEEVHGVLVKEAWIHYEDQDILTCPPDNNSSATYPNIDDDGETVSCSDPSVIDKYLPKPIDLDSASAKYADDYLTQWHNESINELKGWEPYTKSTGEIEPEYIESYNQPGVSETFNEYLKHVASGNYQTSDPNAPNYVPADMVVPTQVAISAATNGESFVDPTTSEVKNPETITDGAATKAPAPDGSAANPFHVTGGGGGGAVQVEVVIPEDDTISQTEYEESNAKFFQQFANAAVNTQAETDGMLQTAVDGDGAFIDSLTPDVVDASGLPDFPVIADLWSVPTGACVPYTSEASIAGNMRIITYDKHCPTYNAVVHPLLVWFLYISTALYVIHLAGRTFKSTVS